MNILIEMIAFKRMYRTLWTDMRLYIHSNNTFHKLLWCYCKLFWCGKLTKVKLFEINWKDSFKEKISYTSLLIQLCNILQILRFLLVFPDLFANNFQEPETRKNLNYCTQLMRSNIGVARHKAFSHFAFLFLQFKTIVQFYNSIWK